MLSGGTWGLCQGGPTTLTGPLPRPRPVRTCMLSVKYLGVQKATASVSPCRCVSSLMDSPRLMLPVTLTKWGGSGQGTWNFL